VGYPTRFRVGEQIFLGDIHGVDLSADGGFAAGVSGEMSGLGQEGSAAAHFEAVARGSWSCADRLQLLQHLQTALQAEGAGAKEDIEIRRRPVLAFSVRQLTVIKIGPKRVSKVALEIRRFENYIYQNRRENIKKRS
jgi:hypothetical protein